MSSLDFQWDEKPKEKRYSEILDDTFWDNNFGQIEFQSGVIYNKNEIRIMLGQGGEIDPDGLRAVHLAKIAFKNKVEVIK